MLKTLYRFFFTLAYPVLLFRLWWLGRHQPGYRQHIKQRFGFAPKLDRCIWLHAVSLGESIAAKPLIDALLNQYPHIPLLITNTTATGHEQIERQYGQRVQHAFLPYDTGGAIRRFLQRTRPLIAIIMETELWPTLIDICDQQQIPIIIANARLSARSLKRYHTLGRFIIQTLQKLTYVLAQSNGDAQHFQQLGVSRTLVAGNLKYDRSLAPPTTHWKQHWENRPCWVAASTHAGEETAVLEAHQIIRQHHPNALLILVPRHPERFDQVSREAEAITTTTRRSQGWPTTDSAVLIGDSLGELMDYYAAADIAFVGGSLQPIGGHNLIEPATLSKPIITGPHLHHCTAIRDHLQNANALTIIHTPAQLAQIVRQWMAEPEQAKQYGQRGQVVVQRHRGACQKHLNKIDALLQETHIK